jgi:hypothetical protein
MRIMKCKLMKVSHMGFQKEIIYMEAYMGYMEIFSQGLMQSRLYYNTILQTD